MREAEREAELLVAMNDLLPRIVDMRLELQRLVRDIEVALGIHRPALTLVANPSPRGDE